MIRKFLFRNQRTGQTIIKNTFWLLSGEAISRVARAVITIYAARILGAAGYGAFSFAMAIGNFALIFSDLGVTAVIGREVAKDHSQRQRYFTNGLILKLIVLAINIAVVILIIPPFIRVPGTIPLLPLIAALLFFETLRDFGVAFFRAMEQMEVDAFVKIFMNLLITGVGFYYLKSTGTAWGITMAYVIGTGLGLLLSVATLFSKFPNWLIRPEKGFIKNLAATAWPIGFLALVGAFMLNIDMVMLGWMDTPIKLGLYAAAQKPIQLLYAFPVLLASAMFPAVARLAKENASRLTALLEAGVKATVLIALPIATGGIIMAHPLMQFLYGNDFAGATLSFQILLLTLVIVSAFAVTNNVILAYNKQMYFIRFFLMGVGANTILNSLLIPPFSIAGAATATIIAQLLTYGLMLYKIKQLVPFSLVRGLSRPFIATFIMSIFIWALSHLDVPVLINVGAGAILYLGLLLALKEPLLKDFRQVLRPPQ